MASTILTPTQAAAKNQKLPKGYLFVPTGLLSVCASKRKRKPTEKGEELHNALERANPSISHSSHAVTPKKANPAQELAAKERQLKIALLKNRLKLLKARQSVLATAPASLSPLPSTPSIAIPEHASRLGKRVIRPVTRDLPPSPERTKPRRIKPKTPKRTEEKANGATSPPKKRAPKANPELEKQLADLNAAMMSLTKQLASQKPAAERAPKLPKNATPLTNREKQSLKTDIFKLPADKVEPIIQMCSANKGVEDKSEDSVTIDIDKLDIPILRELQKYVKKCLNQMNRKKGGPREGPTLTMPLPTTPSLPRPSPSSDQQITPRPPPSRKSESESGDSSSSEDSDSESEAEFKAPSSTPQLPRTPNLAQAYDMGWDGSAQEHSHAPLEQTHKDEGQFYDLMDSLG